MHTFDLHSSICERFNNSTLVAVFPREPLSYTSTFVSTAGVFTFCTVFTWFLGNALIYIYGVERKLFKSRTNYNKIGQLQTNISKKKNKDFHLHHSVFLCSFQGTDSCNYQRSSHKWLHFCTDCALCTHSRLSKKNVLRRKLT